MEIAIINGPNLNLLGTREPEVYGDVSFDEFLPKLKDEFPSVHLEYYQSNIEGELINRIQEFGFKSNGIVLNAGAYTHTSAAIGDAVAAVEAPVVEVHISNVFSREPFRHESFISPHAVGVIVGLGLPGYSYAIRYLMEARKSKDG